MKASLSKTRVPFLEHEVDLRLGIRVLQLLIFCKAKKLCEIVLSGAETR